MATTHPSLTGFQAVAEALDAAGGYATGAALVRYASETDEQYDRRRAVAWYVNDLRSACARFVAYLAKRPPMRDTANPLLTAFLDDCDGRGNSLDVFLSGFMVQARARGSMLVLVDMPRALPDDLASQVAWRAYPYLVAIAPEEVSDYGLDDLGNLTRVEITRAVDGKPRVHGWDTTRWWVTEDGREIEGGEHGLGVCPVQAFADGDHFPALAGFSGIAPLSKRLYNLRSELDEILRRHTFPVFHAEFPILEAVENELPESLSARQAALIEALKTAIANLGRDRGIVTPGGVAFVAPPEGPAQVYREAIADIEAKVRELALTVDMPGERAAESGLALTIRFQALNSALTEFAVRMEDLERRVLAIVCGWLQLSPDTITTQWARDYQIADVAAELTVLAEMQAAGMPEATITAQMRRVAQSQFASADPETLTAVLAGIDERDAEVGAA